MKITKKILLSFAVSMLFLMVAMFMPNNVSASNGEETYEYLDLSEYILQAGGLGYLNEQQEEGSSEIKQYLSSEGQTVESIIYEGIKNREEIIDVSSCNLTKADLSKVYWKVIDLNPELFFARATMYYYQSNGYVTRIQPGYDPDYTEEHSKAYEERVEEILSGVDDSWSDIQKVLYLHDYLVTNVEYDKTYSNYNAYNALVEGSSVCNGYALATVCLLKNVGVNVDVITSEELNHAWNMVELDGEYFYIDATWDDPTNTGETYCKHTNFMVDEAGLVAVGHDSTDWVSKSSGSITYGNIETSSRYMDYFWADMITAIPMIDTKAGYISEGELNVFDFSDSTVDNYDRNVGKWYVFGSNSSYYSRDYCALVAAEDAFYYTTHQDIYRMDLDGTGTKVYSLSSDELTQGYIYGLTASGRKLTYILQTEPHGDVVYSGTYRISTPIDNFITVMYQQCLVREPSEVELEEWSNRLKNGEVSGAEFVEEIIFCREFFVRNLSNVAFMDVLYNAVLNKEADNDEKSEWVALLDARDLTRSQVTKSFVESSEFSAICSSCGIECGTYDASIAPLELFVDRFYTICLGRNPDQGGLYNWVNNLNNQYMSGADIAKTFVFSTEVISKNLSNEAFMDLMYRTMMGREADAGGKSGWVNKLDTGSMTRSQIAKNFVESAEFNNICSNYGIVCGTYDASIVPLEKFVNRFYSLCLERNSDQSGIYYWVNCLKNKTISGAKIAEQFFCGAEFVNKNVADEKYIEILYNVLMGRASDEGGRNNWVSLLQNGYVTRWEVMNNFIISNEFTGICEKYGIERGSLN